MRKEIEESIKEVMSKVFDVSIKDIPDDIEIGGIPQWDSLGQLNLMLALEGEFGVHFTTDLVLELNSLKKITDFLKKEV